MFFRVWSSMVVYICGMIVFNSNIHYIYSKSIDNYYKNNIFYKTNDKNSNNSNNDDINNIVLHSINNIYGNNSIDFDDNDNYNINDIERSSLYDFYNSTNGIHWSWKSEKNHWNFTSINNNPCHINSTWQGLQCTLDYNKSDNNIYHYIISINLQNYNLIGSIPDSISNFTYLQELMLDYNYITNIIPPSLQLLSNSLRTLSLVSNQLMNNLPCWLFNNMSLLEEIDLNSNYFDGNLCSIIAINNQLKRLTLSNNMLAGTLPLTLYKLQSLHLLILSNNLLAGILSSTIGKMLSLSSLILDNNMFNYTIPKEITYLTNLSNFNLNSNYFSGSLPTEFQNLIKLQSLLLNNNILRGSIINCFNSTKQNSLLTVQINNNQITGYLPVELFKISTLVSFAAVSNCFIIYISPIICHSDSITNLILDGLNTATSCRSYYFPKHISTSYTPKKDYITSIPECIFNMTKLSVLHLSGNGIRGKFSDDLILNDNLYDLTLSHNRLSGKIPRTIQQREWINLDLTSNRFNGILYSSFGENLFNSTKYVLNNLNFHDYNDNLYYDNDINNNILAYCNLTLQSSLKEIENCESVKKTLTKKYILQQNRLSGKIPSYFYYIDNIDLLEGNSFDCKIDKSNLPIHDRSRQLYECGTNTFFIPYDIWLSIIIILLLIILFVWVYIRLNLQKYCKLKFLFNYLESSPIFQMKTILSKSSIVKRLSNYIIFFKRYNGLCRLAFIMLIIIFFIFLPLYLILNNYYGTHQYKYAYIISMMYISGEIPALILMLLLFLFHCFIRYLVVNYVNKINEKLDDYNNGNVENDNNRRNNSNQTDLEINDSNSSDSTNRSDSTINDEKNNDDIMNDDNKKNYINNDRLSLPFIDLYEYYRQSVVFTRDSAQSLFDPMLESVRYSLYKIITVNYWQTFFLYFSFFLTNFIVVVGVNIAFVYVSIYQSSDIVEICQFLLTLFDTAWEFFLPYLLRLITSKLWEVSLDSHEDDLSNIWSKLILILFFLYLFNTIIVRSIVVLIISPNCFYHLYEPEHVVYSHYIDKNTCLMYNDKTCLPQESTTSYDPPFIYTYQCASDIIEHYAPSYVYKGILLAFGYPLFLFFRIYLHKNFTSDNLVHNIFDFVYPLPILKGIVNLDMISNNSDISTLQIYDMNKSSDFERMKCDKHNNIIENNCTNDTNINNLSNSANKSSSDIILSFSSMKDEKKINEDNYNDDNNEVVDVYNPIHIDQVSHFNHQYNKNININDDADDSNSSFNQLHSNTKIETPNHYHQHKRHGHNQNIDNHHHHQIEIHMSVNNDNNEYSNSDNSNNNDLNNNVNNNGFSINYGKGINSNNRNNINSNLIDQSINSKHHVNSEVLFETCLEIVSLLILISDMLTFGLIFPLLAIISMTTIVMSRITSQYICDRYLYHIIYHDRKNRKNSSRISSFRSSTSTLASSSSNLFHYIDKLDHEFHGIINETVIKNAFWMILLCSSSFYSFFLFDTLGDDLGFRKSFLILIVTTLIPCYVYIIELIYNYLCHRNDNNRNRNSNSKNNNINDMPVVNDRAINAHVPITINKKVIKSSIADNNNDNNNKNREYTGSLHGNREIINSLNRESINTIIEMNRTRRSSSNNNNENIVRDINPGDDDDDDDNDDANDDDDDDKVDDVNSSSSSSSSTSSSSKEDIPESNMVGIELTRTKS